MMLGVAVLGFGAVPFIGNSGGSRHLIVGPEVLARLEALRLVSKYQEEPGTLYTGLRPESVRRIAEAQLNALIDLLLRDLPKSPTAEFVLAEFSATLKAFAPPDSEDRERLCRYLEEIMDTIGLESSDGLLNRWLYGFDPN